MLLSQIVNFLSMMRQVVVDCVLAPLLELGLLCQPASVSEQ